MFEHRRRGVAEKQLFTRTPAHTHDEQVAGRALRLRQDGLMGCYLDMHSGLDLQILAIGHFSDFAEDGARLCPRRRVAT